MDTVSSNIRAFLQDAAAKENLELSTDRDIWKAEAERMTSGYDTAQSELAALREELDESNRLLESVRKDWFDMKSQRDSFQQRLADAERRNAVLTEALEGMIEYFPEGHSDGECFSVERAKAALTKPEEAKS